MKTVLFLCGGKSQEHEISLISAKCVLDALDTSRYTPVIVGIDKHGVWHLQENQDFYTGEFRADKIALKLTNERVSFDPYLGKNGRGRIHADGRIIEFDVVFPILHGPFGEDGTLQGMLDIVGIPYVGSGCASSAVCMDKALTKAACERLGIPVAPYRLLLTPSDLASEKAEIQKLKLPLFVKPARLGSSVGITRVTEFSQLEAAVAEAFRHDSKVLVEQGISGREIECGILGDKASVPGEILVDAEVGWYSYDAKYISKTTARTVAPADLPPVLFGEVQETALRIFRALECKGLARVDLLLEHGTNRIYLNEVNTLPGFTPISMYPILWQATGVPYSRLISELIELA